MQPSPSRSSRLPSLGRTAAVLAAGVLLAACDRHSATEVPESYGHGSSHERNYRKGYEDHTIDSRRGSDSFSDTQGLDTTVGGENKAAAGPSPAASPSPTASAAPGRFFPNGS